MLDHFILEFRMKQRMHDAEKLEWQLEDLHDFVISEIKQRQPKPILLLVDASDECSDSDAQGVVKVLEQLSVNAVHSRTVLRICLSSRAYLGKTISMKTRLELMVESNDAHRQDIARYVTDELVMPDEEIRQEILEKADGVFLWAVLVVAMLNETYDTGRVEEVRRILDDLPSDLEKVFDTILAKDDPYRDETLLMLQWVLFSPHPMKPEELFLAVVVKVAPELSKPRDRTNDTDTLIQKRITNLSKGLIEVRPGDEQTVQFIHRSVSDFLLRNQRLQKLDPTLGPEPERASYKRLWECCWQYIKLADIKLADMPIWDEAYCDKVESEAYGVEIEAYEVERKAYCDEVESKYPFMRYAMKFVFQFANVALPHDDSYQKQHTGDLTLSGSNEPDYLIAQQGCEITQWLLNCESSWFDFWSRFISTFGGRSDDVDAEVEVGLIYNLSLNSYQRLLKIALSRPGVEVNAQGGFYGNALQAASYTGSQEVVKLLLDVGAEVNAQGGTFGNALQAASWRGSQEVVKLLLDAGAEVNAQGGEFGNALQAASYTGRGRQSQEVVKLLLDVGAEVNAQGGYYGNALQAASWRGPQQVVKLLLDAGAEVNAQGGFYGNALQAASYRGSQEVVRLLLDAGAASPPGGKIEGVEP